MGKRLLIKSGVIVAVLALIAVGILSVFRGCTGGGGIGLFGGGGGGGTGGDGTGPTDSTSNKTDGSGKTPPDPIKKPDDKSDKKALPKLPGVQETPDGIQMNIRVADTSLEFDGQAVTTREFLKEIERIRFRHPGKVVRVQAHPAANAKERTLAELAEALRGVNVLYTPP